jgi:hypothetical protein
MTDYELTNDLRAYFESVGLQRPADGELSRAIEATARVRPRPAWQAQLMIVVEPLRWPASAGLRYALWIVLLLLLLALLSVGFAGFGRAPSLPGSNPFEGRWITTDPSDGSEMLLVVSTGQSPDVRFEDAFASACLQNGDENTHWISVGSATTDADTLYVEYPDGGGCTSWHVVPYGDTLTRDRATGTLVDSSGNVWQRRPRQ